MTASEQAELEVLAQKLTTPATKAQQRIRLRRIRALLGLVSKEHRPGWRRNAIYMEVTGQPGAHINDIGEDMLALSKQLDIGVLCKINGVRTFAWPHFTEEQVRQSYELGQVIAKEQATCATSSTTSGHPCHADGAAI